MNNMSFVLIILSPTGKILNDDTALKEYKIDEKNFVVVMVAKVRRLSVFRTYESEILKRDF